MAEIGCCEGDCKAGFEDDKGEFYPEGGAEDSVLAEVDSKTLILPADEYGRDNVSSDEEQKHNVVYPRIMRRIENTEQNQTACPNDCECD